ncbi:MAG: hypothetical protein M0R22_04495 [Dehalococcoidia bacterium]|jgi:hypothetical protein|nr:hypothetical protein [Dehalococcoidia bacterium]
MAYSDATVLEKLQARRDAILDELAAMTSASAGGKPDSTQGGIGHVAYKKSLYEELDMITGRLAGMSQEPFEVVVEGCT